MDDDVQNFLDQVRNQSRQSPEERAVDRKRDKPTAAQDSGLAGMQLTERRKSAGRVIMNNPGIENAMRQIGTLPEPEWSIHGLMGGDFHGFDVLPMIQRLAGRPVEGLHIATLGFNQKNNLQLCRMMDEGLVEGPVTIVASQYFAKTDPEVWKKAKHEIESRGSSLCSTRNHAKIIALRAGTDHFVSETSANLRSCNSLEQFTLTNSEPLYRFHTGWITHIADQHR